MNRKNMGITVVFALAVSLISVSVTTALLTNYASRRQFLLLGGIFQELTKQQPESASVLLKLLKEQQKRPKALPEDNILPAYGYHPSDFIEFPQKHSIFFAGIGLLSGALLLVSAFLLLRRRLIIRIDNLIVYLEKVNRGERGLLLPIFEDDFSRLQDEIYKTVTSLYQAKDAALEAKNNFADNLSNIAHQLKTPITSISLSCQSNWDGRPMRRPTTCRFCPGIWCMTLRMNSPRF